MPRRRLTDDERDLWQRVAQTARRLAPAPSPSPHVERSEGPVHDPGAPAARPTPLPRAPSPHVAERIALSPGSFPEPRVRVDLSPSVSDHLAREPVRMDHGLHRRMVRGRLDPEARLDLHGMTVAQAHQALTGFVLSAHARGLRLVLVITGKGRRAGADHAAPMPTRAGVLKHDVPRWLRAAPLGPVVLELREAHRSHGGSGAYYVYLRKRR